MLSEVCFWRWVNKITLTLHIFFSPLMIPSTDFGVMLYINFLLQSVILCLIKQSEMSLYWLSAWISLSSHLKTISWWCGTVTDRPKQLLVLTAAFFIPVRC